MDSKGSIANAQLEAQVDIVREACDYFEVSERSERALRKTRSMDLAKWLQPATSTTFSTNLTLFLSIRVARSVCFARASLKMRLASLCAARRRNRFDYPDRFYQPDSVRSPAGGQRAGDSRQVLEVRRAPENWREGLRVLRRQGAQSKERIKGELSG